MDAIGVVIEVGGGGDGDGNSEGNDDDCQVITMIVLR